MPLGTHLGGKMGEDGAQDRQLGAKMGPTWPIWNRNCTLGRTFWSILATFWGSWVRKAQISKISFPPRREHDFQGLRASWEAYLGPSWRYVGTSWRQDGTQDRQEANLQRPPWHKWTPPEAVRGRQARWQVIRRLPISPSPDPSPCSYQRGQ